jgi:hypothetical protein
LEERQVSDSGVGGFFFEIYLLFTVVRFLGGVLFNLFVLLCWKLNIFVFVLDFETGACTGGSMQRQLMTA